MPTDRPLSRRRWLARSAAVGWTLAWPTRRGVSDEPFARSAVSYHDATTFRVESEAVVVPGGADLSTLTVWLPLPTSAAAQRVEAVRLSDDLREAVAADRETRVAVSRRAGRTLAGPGPYRSLISATIVRSAATTDVDRLLGRPRERYREGPRAVRHLLGSVPLVETEDALIGRFAAAFDDGRRPYAAVARDLFVAVASRTAYRDGPMAGAAACLRAGAGNCADAAALFVAGCRSVGIPARLCVGFYAPGTDRPHVWAEFLLPDGTWVPADPSEASFRRNPAAGFGRLPADRVAVSRSDDIRLRGPEPNSASVLQTGRWWWSGGAAGTAPTATFRFTADAIG